MKILFVCENYYPHYGGAEVVFKNLAEGFAKAGHQVLVLTHQLKNTLSQESINKVSVHRISSLHSRYIFSFVAILPALKQARSADIIQTTTFNGAFPAWIAAKIRRKPVVLTVHEVWVGKWGKITGFGYVKSMLHDLLERLIYLLPFDHYVCVSHSTKNDLLKLNIPSEKVSVIYNGLDYDFWNPAKVTAKEVQSLRKELGLEKKFIYFAWGRPGESKGFEYLIAAAAIIAQKIPNSMLLLMFGSIDKYPQKYQQLMKIIGNNLHIKVITSIPYDQLRTYVALANCVVVPSLAEGFGYNAVEAIAMGKPVVVSDAGSLPEVVSGKFQIFESKNVGDLAKKVSAVARGGCLRTKERKFEWEECIKNYIEIYSRLSNRK